MKTPTRPQAQLKTATGFEHGHVEVLRAASAAAAFSSACFKTATGFKTDTAQLQAAASAAAFSASTVRAAWAAPASRGEIQNEIVPLPRARAVQQG